MPWIDYGVLEQFGESIVLITDSTVRLEQRKGDVTISGYSKDPVLKAITRLQRHGIMPWTGRHDGSVSFDAYAIVSYKPEGALILRSFDGTTVKVEWRNGVVDQTRWLVSRIA